MLPEFIKELDDLYKDLEGGLGLFSPRREKVIVDVYQAIGGIGGGGLESFWSADIPRKRMVKSFRVIGEHRIAEILKESKWIEKYFESKIEIDEKEMELIDELNAELWDGFIGIPTKLAAFAKRYDLM